MEFILGESIHVMSGSGHQISSTSSSSMETNPEQSLIRQTYSRLSTMYCMLTDYYKSELSVMHASSFRSLNLETLALKWMEPTYEIREAAQTLLKNELKRMGPNGRAALIKSWEPHLSSLLKEFDELNQMSSAAAAAAAAVTQQQQQQQQSPVQQLSPAQLASPSPQQQQQQSQSSGQQLSAAQSSASLMSLQSSSQASLQQQQQQQVHSELHHQESTAALVASGGSGAAPSHSTRIKRKQYVSIIILSLIGAEFGQDVNANKSQMPYKTIPQGFSLEDHSILKRISTSKANKRKTFLNVVIYYYFLEI